MNTPFSNIETLFFCDESKFYLNNGDFEDALFYFAIPVHKNEVKTVNDEFDAILKKHRIQSSVFHATRIFRGKKHRPDLIKDITDLIISHGLLCFCFKYPKNAVFEQTKLLDYLNDGDMFDFNDPEFQALFYFLILLNTHLVEDQRLNLPGPYQMFFDRNVYGKEDTEAFNFPHPNFAIKGMTFCEKSNISLLALPDFFGYVFRQVKNFQNKMDANQNPQPDELILACQESLFAINKAGLFFLIHLQDYLPNLGKALNINFD